MNIYEEKYHQFLDICPWWIWRRPSTVFDIQIMNKGILTILIFSVAIFHKNIFQSIILKLCPILMSFSSTKAILNIVILYNSLIIV